MSSCLKLTFHRLYYQITCSSISTSNETTKWAFPIKEQIKAHNYISKTSVATTSSSLSLTNCTHWYPTQHEKSLLRETWSEDFDFLYLLGSNIYEYIFENNPNTKKLFHTIHQHGKLWKESPEFRRQALMFVQTLSMCIESINNTDAMAGRLQKIGEKHVQYAHRGFKPIFWDIFLDALEKGLSNHIHSFKQLDDKILQETIIVWRKLANFIISNMKRGYVKQLVKDFKEQDGSLGEWSKKHPCFNKK